MLILYQFASFRRRGEGCYCPGVSLSLQPPVTHIARRGSLPVLSDAVRSKRRCPGKSESRSPGLASRPFGRRPVEKTLSEEVGESLAGARFSSFRTPSGRKDAVRGSQKVARQGSLPVLSDAIRSKRRCPRKSESRLPGIVLWTLSEVGRLSSNDLCHFLFQIISSRPFLTI